MFLDGLGLQAGFPAHGFWPSPATQEVACADAETSTSVGAPRPLPGGRLFGVTFTLAGYVAFGCCDVEAGGGERSLGGSVITEVLGRLVPHPAVLQILTKRASTPRDIVLSGAAREFTRCGANPRRSVRKAISAHRFPPERNELVVTKQST